MKKIFLGITAVILLAFASNLYAAPSEYYINATSTPGCINVTTAGLLWSSGSNCGGGGSSSIGPINTLQASDGSGGFIATGTPTLTVGSLFATSTTATSTVANALYVGTTTDLSRMYGKFVAERDNIGTNNGLNAGLGFSLINSTPALESAQQWSPIFFLGGRAYLPGSGVDALVAGCLQAEAGQAVSITATSSLILGTSIGGGACGRRVTVTSGSRLGIGATTTPGTDLSIGNTGDATINISASATSTFGSGLNIRTGCYAVNGTCVGGLSGGSTDSLAYWTSGSTLSATTSPTVGYITATTTTPSRFASSATFDGGNVTVGADGIGVSINDPSGTYGIYGTTGDYDYVLADQDSGIGFYLKEISSGRQINLLNTGSQLATFVGSGNFGIGTSSPYSRLSVVGQVVGANFVGTTTAYNQFINQKNTRVDAIDSTGITTYSFDGDPVLRTGNLGGDTVEVIAGLTVGANAIVTGKVGVGSTTPFSKLAVKGGGTTTGVNFQTTNSLNTPIITSLDNGKVGIGTSTPPVKFAVTTTEHSSANPSDMALYDSAGREVLGLAAWSGGGGATGYGSVVLNSHCAGGSCRLGEMGGKNTVNTYRLADIIFETNTAADNGRTFLLNGVGSGAFRYAWYCTHDGRCSMNGGNSTTVISSPTAVLHLRAGETGASAAPLKFNSGSLQTTAEVGAVEFLTDKWYATITTGAARKEIALNDSALSVGSLVGVTTNGRLTSTTTVYATAFNATSTSATSTFSGGVVFQKPPKLPSYTVATLPTCNAGAQGSIAYVTDGNAPTYLTAIAGGGAVVTPVFCDATNWVAH